MSYHLRDRQTGSARSHYIASHVYRYMYIHNYICTYLCISMCCIDIRELANVLDGKSDSVWLQYEALRLRCFAMRCKVVCAGEEKRFLVLVFPVGSAMMGHGGPWRAVACPPLGCL